MELDGGWRGVAYSVGCGTDSFWERLVFGLQGKGRARTFEDSLFRTIFGISSDHKSSGGGAAGGSSSGGGHGGAASGGKEKGLKLSISGTAAKKGPLVMLEKERKKDSVRSVEQVPPASPWTHGEDAVLCAVVHEYGGNWQLASDALAGGPDGGVYRGRHRHPIHCRERFRQLLARTAAAASGDPTSEKSAVNAATNAQLRVTEVGVVEWRWRGVCGMDVRILVVRASVRVSDCDGVGCFRNTRSGYWMQCCSCQTRSFWCSGISWRC
jgi:hypothetical protein